MSKLPTLAKQYKLEIGDDTLNSMELTAIARTEMADLFSNREYSWIEFCDGSVLSSNCGDITAYNKLQRFHKNGVSW